MSGNNRVALALIVAAVYTTIAIRVIIAITTMEGTPMSKDKGDDKSIADLAVEASMESAVVSKDKDGKGSKAEGCDDEANGSWWHL